MVHGSLGGGPRCHLNGRTPCEVSSVFGPEEVRTPETQTRTVGKDKKGRRHSDGYPLSEKSGGG